MIVDTKNHRVYQSSVQNPLFYYPADGIDSQRKFCRSGGRLSTNSSTRAVLLQLAHLSTVLEMS